jgi:hypothetical protein
VLESAIAARPVCVVPTASISGAGQQNPLNPTGHINPRSPDDLPSCRLVSAAVDGRCDWSCGMFRGTLRVRHVSVTARGNVRFSLFWDVARRIMVVGARRVGTTCRFCLQE